MTSPRIPALALTVVAALGLLGTAQSGQGIRRSSAYEREMQNPAEDPPDAYQEAEFAFARLRYRSPQRGRGRASWGTDSNKAERQFAQGVRRLQRIHTRSVTQVIDVDRDAILYLAW